MKFDQPAGKNDTDRMSVIGQPLRRIDGPLKTTGTAPYAYERHDVAQGQLVGFPLGAAIAKGHILEMDTAAAEAAPGVMAVVGTLDMEPLPKDSWNNTHLFGGAEVAHYHQAIAVVVAETFEQARAAAALITVRYETDETAQFDLEAAHLALLEQSVEPVSRVGDFEAAFAGAPVTLDETYRTGAHSHAMMEPHATVALWDDDGLTVWTSNQMIAWNKRALSKTLSLDPDRVRVDSPFIGGGFGAKLFLRSDAVLAALGSRRTGRPVKLMLPRPFIANNTTHRAMTIQRLRIGADRDGRITAIAHESTSNTQPGGGGENAVEPTREFYAGANRLIIHRPAEMHLPESHAMRAPGETSGLMALEIAMDEMAEKLGMDPVAFRIANDTQVVPEHPERPFSERHLVEALETGAAAFDWSARNPVPGQVRAGRWLIGQGVAGAFRGAPVQASAARLRLQGNGTLIVETDMTDIGTGTYTILAQTAAEMMGLPVERVDVRLGDSAFPVSAGSGGQFGAASSTAGVYAAAIMLRETIAERLGAGPDDLSFEQGAVRMGEKVIQLSELASGGELIAEDGIAFGTFRKEKVRLATFGAHFTEVGVNVVTGEIRVRRMLAVCDAGRILNPVTARSQMIGAMTMGVGAALMEDLVADTGLGLFINHDLAGYEVPVHADIPTQEVIFLDHPDASSTPLKAKGVGELGLCGVSASIANAVYNATGIRVRDYPLTLDKLIDRLPPV